MAQSAASQPFNAPLRSIQGFSPDQEAAFSNYRNAPNWAQPYFDAATGYTAQSASPITGAEVSNYLNPYSNFVLGNLAESQGQQMHDLTGRLRAQAGGTNADRIAVGQGELARQQNLATGQTLANLYSPALAAAQQDRQRQAAAGNAFANYGTGSQNAFIQGTGALYGAGNAQQQLGQAGRDAQYQYELARAAYPYQNSQFLANITGGLSGAMGGTTTKTSPGPSWLSQALGAGTAIAGVGGEMGWWGPNSAASNQANQNNWWQQAGQGYGPYAAVARGGRVGMADGGSVGAGQSPYPSWMTANSYIPMQAPVMSQSGAPKMEEASGKSDNGFGDIMSTAIKMLPMFLSAGGTVKSSPFPMAYADGGDVSGKPGEEISPTFNDRWGDTAYNPVNFNDRTSPDWSYGPMGSLPDAQPFPPPPQPDDTDIVPDPGIQRVDPKAVDAWRADASGPGDGTNGGDDGVTTTPDSAVPVSGPRSFDGKNVATLGPNDAASKADLPYPDLDPVNSTSRKWARSPWMALINAGLATMAGESPFAGVNIGKGFQQGLKTLQDQNKDEREEQGVNQRAQQLMLEAKKHLDQYSKMTPYQQGQLDIARESAKRQDRATAIAQQRADAYDRSVTAAEKRAAEAAMKNTEQERRNRDPLYKQDVKRLGKIEESGTAANAVLDTVDKIEELSKTATTGPLIGEALKYFNEKNAQLESLLNSQALDIAQKLKGSFSDRDIFLVKSIAGNLGQTAAARKGNIDALRTIFGRAAQHADFMRDYLEANGSLSGAEKQWSTFNRANPMFDAKDKFVGRERDYTEYLNPKYKASSAPAEEAPKKGDRKQFKQGWGVFDGTKWVPE